MSKLPKVSKRSIYGASIVSLGSIISAGLAFVAQALMARTLSPSSFGEFSAALAFLNIFLPLAAFGAPQLLLRVYGESEESGHSALKGILYFSVSTTVLVTLLLGTWLVLRRAESELTLYFLPIIVSSAGVSLALAIRQLQDDMVGVFGWQTLQNFFRVVVVVSLAVLHTKSPVPYAIGYGISAGIICTFAIRALVRYFNENARALQCSLNSVFLKVGSQAWKYGLEGFLYLVYYNSAVVITGATVGSEAAGFYAAAVAALAAVYLVPAAVFQRFLLPKLHRAAFHERKLLRQTLDYGSAVLFVSGLLVMALVWALSDLIILWVFGGGYEFAASVLKVIVLSVPMKFATFAPGAIMATGALQLGKLKIMASGAVICVVLVLLMSDRFGVLGAAWAIVITDLFLLLAMWLGASRNVLRERS